MKKVMLFVPPASKIEDAKQSGIKWPRIGLAYIAAYLREKDVDVNVLDCRALGLKMNDIADAINDINPAFFASGPFTEEISSAYEVFKLAKKLKPGITNVIGGPHATAIPEKTLEEFPKIDIVVYGEGEISMADLVEINSKEDLHKINGIVYRDGERIIKNNPNPHIEDIDKLPYPAWDLFPLQAYKGILTIGSLERVNKSSFELPILSTRGCPFQCNFCFKTFGNNVRKRDPKKIVDELEYNYKNYCITHTAFVEGSFAIDKRNAIEMCDDMIKRKLHEKIKWICETRVDLVDESFLHKMKEAGCEEIDFGVESGDEDIMRKSKKGITILQARRAVRLAKKADLRVGCYFIIGHPNETKETIKKTFKLARQLDADIMSIGIMVPYPGTEINEMALKEEGNYKILSSCWLDYTKQRGGPLEIKNLSLEEIKRIQSREYIKYYLRPRKIYYILKTLPLRKVIKIMKSLAREYF